MDNQGRTIGEWRDFDRLATATAPSDDDPIFRRGDVRGWWRELAPWERLPDGVRRYRVTDGHRWAQFDLPTEALLEDGVGTLIHWFEKLTADLSREEAP
jgi:hypothetical protein